MPRAPRKRIANYFLYGEAPRSHDERTLHVETIEARSLRHHWKIDPHRHGSLHQLIIVLRGRGVALAEGSVSHFSPPAVIRIPAGAVHGFEFEPGTLGFVVTLSTELLQDLSRREPALAGVFAEPETMDLPRGQPFAAELVRVARQLAREHRHATTGRALLLEGLVAVLLGNLMRLTRTIEQGDVPPDQHRQLVARFRALVESEFRRNIPIPDYARALQVPESRLRNACLSATGQPPIHLVHGRVLLEAKRQLFYTSNPVSEIAYALGFDDPAYFTRFFTRRAGQSPRAFRSMAPLSR